MIKKCEKLTYKCMCEEMSKFCINNYVTINVTERNVQVNYLITIILGFDRIKTHREMCNFFILLIKIKFY